MKTDRIFRFCTRLLLVGAPSLALAAPLREPTSVHARPDANAPVITVLAAGTEEPAAAGENAPKGWLAVQVAGPHEVYVDNKDITKSLDVKPGAAYRSQPSSDAPVLATAAEGDPVEITGLRGRWTQLRLAKPVTGYAQLSGAGAGAASAATTSPAPAPAAEQASARASARTATPAAAPATGPGRPAPRAASEAGVEALPRLFEGRFVSTRAPLRPRRPYDYAIEDATGARIAYVDLTKLLMTDQIENYLGRTVAAYGIARAVPDTNDIVVTVESLQLR